MSFSLTRKTIDKNPQSGKATTFPGTGQSRSTRFSEIGSAVLSANQLKRELWTRVICNVVLQFN